MSHETPVDWTDDPESSVDIVATAAEDLRGIWRLARAPQRAGVRAQHPAAVTDNAEVSADELLSFAGVGVLSTLSYLFLLALGWSVLGPWIANAAALALCTLINTALHRSLARRARSGREGMAGQPPFAAVVALLYAISLVATTAAIAVVSALAGPSLAYDALAVTVACCVASLARFTLLRGWAFRPPAGPRVPLLATAHAPVP